MAVGIGQMGMVGGRQTAIGRLDVRPHRPHLPSAHKSYETVTLPYHYLLIPRNANYIILCVWGPLPPLCLSG